jgi:hypothetical protein
MKVFPGDLEEQSCCRLALGWGEGQRGIAFENTVPLTHLSREL